MVLGLEVVLGRSARPLAVDEHLDAGVVVLVVAHLDLVDVRLAHRRERGVGVRAAQRREAEKLVRQADYERVLMARAAMAQEGKDESEMPVLPPDPSQEEEVLSQAEADYQAAIAAAAAATKKATAEHGDGVGDGSDGLHRETAGHTLSGGGLSLSETRYLTQSIARSSQTDDQPESSTQSSGGASFGALTAPTTTPTDEGAA